MRRETIGIVAAVYAGAGKLNVAAVGLIAILAAAAASTVEVRRVLASGRYRLM